MSVVVYDLYGECVQKSVSFVCDTKGYRPDGVCDGCHVSQCGIQHM